MKKLLAVLVLTALTIGGCKEKPKVVPMELPREQNSQVDKTTGLFKNGPIETREEMVQALLMLNALDPESSSEFVHVESVEEGFAMPCPEDKNGSLHFVANTDTPPGMYYDFPAPGLEHSAQDHFPYIVDDLFYLQAEHRLLVTLSAIEQGANGYYTDESMAKLKAEVWPDEEWGTIVILNGRYFIEEGAYSRLAQPDCPPYEE